MSTRVLFDTSAFLIAHSEPDQLGEHRRALESPATQRIVPAVVAWEIAIKHGLGKLELPDRPATWFPEMMRRGAMSPHPIDAATALAVSELPPIHRDPFDRLIIATAINLGVPVVTADRIFADYGIETWLVV